MKKIFMLMILVIGTTQAFASSKASDKRTAQTCLAKAQAIATAMRTSTQNAQAIYYGENYDAVNEVYTITLPSAANPSAICLQLDASSNECAVENVYSQSCESLTAF